MNIFTYRLARAWLLSTMLIYALAAVASSERGEPLKPFTVSDEIGVAHFGDPNYGKTEPITVSPDGGLVAIHVERGSLKCNCVEDELRIYSLDQLQSFLASSAVSEAPAPVWSIRESTYREGTLITSIHWLRKSEGLAFLLRVSDGSSQLILADIKRHSLQRLSVESQDVTAFDVRDAAHYVYTVRSEKVEVAPSMQNDAAAAAGTGRRLTELLFPAEREKAGWNDRSELWAAMGDAPSPVIEPGSSHPVVVYQEGQRALALSPDGEKLATALAVSDIPKEWEDLYPAPYPGFPYHIHGGQQDLNAASGSRYLSEYVTIDLHTGQVRPINGAPTGGAVGWWSAGLLPPAWSDNGEALLLPDAFLSPSNANFRAGRPCVAVANPGAGTLTCLQELKPAYTRKGGAEHGYYAIKNLQFEPHSTDKVVMRVSDVDHNADTQVFVRTSVDTWQRSSEQVKTSGGRTVEVVIKESLNEPPVAWAVDSVTHVSRAIWNPNPQLSDLEMGSASVYRWKDGAGRDWIAGLYKPAEYVPGRRYPLVIQTHGFNEREFAPSGVYPTAFAARALAASGIVVLQVKDCPIRLTPDEGPCQVRGYEAAIRKLVAEGVVDPDRIGIVGFSRTVYYVLEALTTSRMSFAAASITDGVDEGYMQYLEAVDAGPIEGNAMLGAPPFGDGLRQWVQRSPAFNMHKVHTPLLVNSEGPISLLYMWEPYAALRYLHKPVDLMLFRSEEHVLTNPDVRLASQGGTVDWFRFWLESYEDSDAAKAGQYGRWEKLCDMQIAEHTGHATFCVPAKH